MMKSWQNIEKGDFILEKYGDLCNLGQALKSALKILDALYYENKISISDDEIKELKNSLESILSYTIENENRLYRFKLANLNECLSSFIAELQKFHDYLSFFKEPNEQVLAELNSAYLRYQKNLDAYNEQCLSDGYNTAGSENQDTAENEKLKAHALVLISSSFKQKDFIIDSDLQEKAAKLLRHCRDRVRHTLPYKIYVSTGDENSNWNYIGYGQSLSEANFYVLNDDDTFGISDDYFKHHVCSAPGKIHLENNTRVKTVKIESECFTEYYDTDVKTNLLGHFGFRRAEGKCFFCKTTFDGYGKACFSIPNSAVFNVVYRCCDECHKKFILPLNGDFRAEKQFMSEFME